MFRIVGCIAQQHEPWLVAVAAIICAFGCFTTLSVLTRARAGERGHVDQRWLAAGAVTGGASIWTTHFVAMLAYHPGFAIGYDIPLTFLSITLAVLLTWLGFLVALHHNAAAGGAIFGIAIGAMHYTGMRALSAPALFSWDGDYVVASLIIGIVLGMGALRVFTRHKELRARIVASILMTLAIAGLHFTAMSALTLHLDPLARVISPAVMAPVWLAIAVAAVMVVIAGFGLAGSIIDQHLAQRAASEASRLRAHIEELETTKAELNRALQRASAASESKSRFLAAMGHELRTPLNIIIGFSDLIAREMYGRHSDERYREYAVDVHNSGSHLLELINGILDFSKIDSAEFSLDEAIFDTKAVVREAVQKMRGEADLAGIRLRLDEDDAVPLLRADERRVRQVLLNLLSNGIKFTPRDKEVSIAIKRQEQGLAILVVDNGIGIADREIPRAFEPFVQVDDHLARKYEGTGLGLALSRRLMELHGGALAIESALGYGTTVIMYFPRERLVVESEFTAQTRIAA